MKMRIEAQQLQPGDVVGISQDIVQKVEVKPNYVYIELLDDAGLRSVKWYRYDIIHIERPDDKMVNSFQVHEPKSWNGISHK